LSSEDRGAIKSHNFTRTSWVKNFYRSQRRKIATEIIEANKKVFFSYQVVVF
jgi:hypothetical protein